MAQPGKLTKAVALAVSAVFISKSDAAASNLEDAADYYLKFAASAASLSLRLGGNGSALSMEALNRGAASTYGRALNDLDNVLTPADIKNHALRQALLYETFAPADPDRYDLDRDGIVTETEIGIFFARDAWKFAFVGYTDGEAFSEITDRFQQRLETLVRRFRDLPGIPPHGDIIVPNTASYTERGLDALKYQGNDQLPYMAIFDVNQDQAVSFEEFMSPLRRAARRADRDDDGLIDETELAAIEERAGDLKGQLREVAGKYGFADPDQE